MAKVTITLTDSEEGVVVTTSYDSEPGKELTDAQEMANWILEDIESGENFMEMLARQG